VTFSNVETKNDIKFYTDEPTAILKFSPCGGAIPMTHAVETVSNLQLPATHSFSIKNKITVPRLLAYVAYEKR
jgi:hypothetical protein